MSRTRTMTALRDGSARATRAIGGSLRAAVLPARLLFAVKTAAAVGIAWLLGSLLPGEADDYSYYAPLGALVSMYPTLMSSVRSSLQTLLGLAVGVGIAAVVVLTVGPSLWSTVVAVAVGTLISGTGWFGIGREYIPMAALFVLIIGGTDAEDYSLGYVLQMAIGVVVGLGVNLLIPPAPLVSEAVERIDAFQHRLAEHLHDIADAVADAEPSDHGVWEQDAHSLAETSRTLRGALAEADESRRGNPRAWLRHTDTSREHARLELLAETAYQIRDISGSLSDSILERPSGLPLDAGIVEPLSDACRAVAELLAADDDLPRHRQAATDAVQELLHAVHRRSIDTDAVTGPGVLTAMHLQRIVQLLEPDEDDEDDDDAAEGSDEAQSR